MSSPSTPIERTAAFVTAASPADAPDLAEVYAKALPPGWPSHELAAACADPNRAVLKATDGKQLFGFVILQFAADEAEVLAIAVAQGWRRLGYAASLLQEAIRACRSRFISCMYLEVAERNSPARKLYEKLGFSEIGRRENYYDAAGSAPVSALILKRDVSPAQVDLEKSST